MSRLTYITDKLFMYRTEMKEVQDGWKVSQLISNLKTLSLITR